MLEELDELIKFIYSQYREFNEKWKKSTYYSRINLKKNKIYDLPKNKKILSTIFNYVNAINENNVRLSMEFKKFNSEKMIVSTRVKTKSSIEYKVRKCIKEYPNGRMTIKKCLNDLFGIRIICKEEVFYNEINQLIKENYEELMCIKSSKRYYQATHVYFRKDDYNFQWELQVWNKADEAKNTKLNKKNKRDYIGWEMEIKGSE